MLEIYRAIAQLRADEQPAVLATVIAKKGSAPREPGAKMVISAAGRIFGTVGGGWPEAQVQKAAEEVIRTGQPRLIWLDLTAEIAAEEGAICGGTMEVYIEPVA